MLPSAEKVILTKTWFENGDQYEQSMELAGTKEIESLVFALDAKRPTDLFFFDHADPRFVLEFIDKQDELLTVMGFRGGLLEESGTWAFVGPGPIQVLDGLIARVAKKKIVWNETLEALLAQS